MSVPIPCPLFDNLTHFGNKPPKASVDYINNVALQGCWRDYELAQSFLNSYAGSSDTFNSYRREIERLLQWSWLIAGKAVRELDRHDIRQFVEFCQNPPLSWITDQYYPRFKDHQGQRIAHQHWRPFVMRTQKAESKQGLKRDKRDYEPSNAAIASLFAVLSTFFTYLLQEEYITANPVQLLRQKSTYIQKNQEHQVTRKLNELQWRYVIDTVQKLANNDGRYERHLFTVSMFYLLGVRISELAETKRYSPRMGNFAPDKYGYWWFTTVGKGNKVRDIAVPDQMLELLKRYRLSRRLTPLPQRGEKSPLLHKHKGQGSLGSRQIRNLVQQCFDAAIDSLKQAGKHDEANDLSAATVHWLRHTAISMDVTYRPREHVRDDSGHANAMITDKYIDIDRVERHRSARHKSLKPFDDDS